MTKRKRGMPKVMWLSPSKFVFESPSKMDFSYDDLRELGLYGKKKVLIVAEQGQDLRFLEGNSSMPDELCWFCKHGFSPFLLNRGDVSGCLLGKNCGWVKFCKDFVPGLTFGQNKRGDMGTRRRRAEEVLSKMLFEHCAYCQHWNTEEVVKTLPAKGGDDIIIDSHAAFCGIQKSPHDWKTPCQNFRLTRNPKERARLEHQKTQLRDYVQKLKSMEELQKHSKSVY